MTGTLTFFVVVAGIVLLLRHIRQREINAFRDADLSVFEEFRSTRKISPTDKTENVIDIALPPSFKTEVVYQLKETLFDEIYERFLKNLMQVVGDRFLVFAKVSLVDFLRVKDGSPLMLSGKTVSFLLCDRHKLNIICGIQLKEAGTVALKHAELLQDVFEQIQKPLLEFPFANNISIAEIREQVRPLISSSPMSRNCPKCGKEMVMRKAVKGSNTGKTFWVCTAFPGCNGISRIGKF